MANKRPSFKKVMVHRGRRMSVGSALYRPTSHINIGINISSKDPTVLC